MSATENKSQLVKALQQALENEGCTMEATPPDNGVLKAYAEGYDCGLSWDKQGKPGGPWIYTARTCGYCSGDGCDRQSTPRWTCKEQIAKMRGDTKENAAWRLGWQHGFAERIRPQTCPDLTKMTMDELLDFIERAYRQAMDWRGEA